jgi:single-strand DNA-binding protein
MANLNKVILAGNLTRDPELSYTPSNTAICKFGLAINRRWRDPQGESREETCFVDCTAFGRQAETINQYMRKGRGLLLEGRLQFSQWTGQDGQKRSKLAVVVERSQFLGGGRQEEYAAGRAPAAAASRDAGPGYHEAPSDDNAYNPAPPEGEGDVPF